MPQHYRLTLKCGHLLETSCVEFDGGLPYVPKYVDQEMPSPPVRCCEGDHTCVEQKKIPRLTGMLPGTLANSDAGWGDQRKADPAAPAAPPTPHGLTPGQAEPAKP